jgi:hypothetical protein
LRAWSKSLKELRERVVRSAMQDADKLWERLNLR